jgi:hypothetical protein
VNHVELAALRHQPTLATFASVAQRYCDCIERWWALPEQYDPCSLVSDVERLPPELYLAATTLPDTGEWFHDDEDEEEDRLRSHHRFGVAYAVIEAKLMYSLDAALEPFAYYREVFDPYEGRLFRGQQGPLPETVFASLGNDLKEVYSWLKEGLLLFEQRTIGGTFGAAFEWRFGFDSHIGEHLTGALRALYLIRRRYADEEDEDEEEAGATT